VILCEYVAADCIVSDVQIVRVKDHVGYYIVDDNGNRTWYPNNDIGDKPLEGFEFVSIDQAYAFYMDYGKRAGFDVRKGGHYKPKPGEDLNLKWFLCSKEGKNLEPAADKSKDVISDVSKITTDENVIVKQTRNRGSSRCGCLAKIRIKKFEGNLYRVYKMVFVPFTGINHHNRCITFASGLLSDETVGAYKWLLEEFKNAFDSPLEQPIQRDGKMEKKLIHVLREKREKMGSSVGTAICNKTDFKRHICDIIWTDQILPYEFEREWEIMIKDFQLDDNKWLQDMFDIRESWIPTFLRDELMAGLMRTTFRSESENHFFGKWTSLHLTLVEFLSHYDTAIEYQRYIERKNDHDSRYKNPKLKTDLQIEKEA
ncbi:FAR1 DNA binding domain, zinc finger, SWIM-type, MULE transposase domain containing protein, partial [Tanacetum coccineum]